MSAWAAVEGALSGLQEQEWQIAFAKADAPTKQRMLQDRAHAQALALISAQQAAASHQRFMALLSAPTPKKKASFSPFWIVLLFLGLALLAL